MHLVDIIIFILYFLSMLGVGLYFMYKNKDADDYYVGGRNMGSWHIGLSVVATDVGGGFSIGLGGVGFAVGISGSWMLFTGLIGAWLAAVLLIPKVKGNKAFSKFLTFPQIFGHFYGARVALMAGVISAIGYIGFTASQVLAGAKLASSTFEGLGEGAALLMMGFIVVVYTFMGGMKAVIYTDTIQWIILMAGLIFIGLPFGYYAIGGYDAIVSTLNPEMLSLKNISVSQIANWFITIVPIWFVGMTLYQRIYASRNVKEAKRAWFIAGLLEWPIMAFMGVLLGLFARVAAEQGMFAPLGFASAEMMDVEKGLPLLLRSVIPAGLMGLILSAYFSAIMSTADSCLMAASGNVVTDLIDKFRPSGDNHKLLLRRSQFATLFLGAFALLLAMAMENVLSLMLYSYQFMVSALLVPILAGLFWRGRSSIAAFWSMLLGGSTTLLILFFTSLEKPVFSEDSTWLEQYLGSIAGFDLPWGLDPIFFGIIVSLLSFFLLSAVQPNQTEEAYH